MILVLDKKKAHKSEDKMNPIRDVEHAKCILNAPELSLILLYGSWNKDVSSMNDYDTGDDLVPTYKLQVDVSPDLTDFCVDVLLCPETLPVMAAVEGGAVDFVNLLGEHISTVSSSKNISQEATAPRQEQHPRDQEMPPIMSTTPAKQKLSNNLHVDGASSAAIRLFVAGDKSQVGKSSVCMGLLGSFLKLGYPPNKLAYIKPATQCEAPQLVAAFCQSKGIECNPVGPVVYYKGFTREFLAGNTEPSDVLLQQAAAAVDKLAQGKDIVIIDGVGYPSVGSICGTSNADVALSCGGRTDDATRSNGSTRRSPAPVLVVGKSGVGDAVDSFNLNASFFEGNNVPVIGAVFNRLSLDGYYSLENCKKAVSDYFESNHPRKKPFGFIPEIPEIASTRESSDRFDTGLAAADIFVDAFYKNVDVRSIISAVKDAQGKKVISPLNGKPNAKKRKMSSQAPKLSRKQIENVAKTQGAAGG